MSLSGRVANSHRFFLQDLQDLVLFFLKGPAAGTKRLHEAFHFLSNKKFRALISYGENLKSMTQAYPKGSETRKKIKIAHKGIIFFLKTS